jgi:hypothetical protein
MILHARPDDQRQGTVFGYLRVRGAHNLGPS